jgi:hypothetical protein
LAGVYDGVPAATVSVNVMHPESLACDLPATAVAVTV